MKGLKGLSWVLISLIMQNFLGEGMWGPIGVHLMFRSRWSMDVPDVLEVERVVLWFSLGVP